MHGIEGDTPFSHTEVSDLNRPHNIIPPVGVPAAIPGIDRESIVYCGKPVGASPYLNGRPAETVDSVARAYEEEVLREMANLGTMGSPEDRLFMARTRVNMRRSEPPMIDY